MTRNKKINYVNHLRARFEYSKQMVETIIPAKATPAKINQKASLGLILNKVLAMAPVQAPVMGNGMPTKTTKPNFPHFS